MSEKKFGKSFQYDLPGDLVMTYLADVRNHTHACHHLICHSCHDVKTLKCSIIAI